MTRDIVERDEFRPGQQGQASEKVLVYLREDGSRRSHPIGSATTEEAFAQAHTHLQPGESFLQMQEQEVIRDQD